MSISLLLMVGMMVNERGFVSIVCVGRVGTINVK